MFSIDTTHCSQEVEAEVSSSLSRPRPQNRGLSRWGWGGQDTPAPHSGKQPSLLQAALPEKSPPPPVLALPLTPGSITEAPHGLTLPLTYFSCDHSCANVTISWDSGPICVRRAWAAADALPAPSVSARPPFSPLFPQQQARPASHANGASSVAPSGPCFQYPSKSSYISETRKSFPISHTVCLPGTRFG